MPGAGVSAGNVLELRVRTGAHEFHASARSVVAARRLGAHPYIHDLGGDYDCTDADKVRQLVRLLSPGGIVICWADGSVGGLDCWVALDHCVV